MRLRKLVNEMDQDLVDAFKRVSKDIIKLFDIVEYEGKRIDKLEKAVGNLQRDQLRFTKVGPKTGRTYTTLAGKVHALAEHLGVEFAVEPKKIVSAKIDVVKVKKEK